MKSYPKSLFLLGVLTLGLMMLTPNSMAGQGEPAGSEWSFRLIPYGWMMGIDGDMTVKGVDASLSVNFGDILENLDIAGELHFEARKGRLGFFFDPSYLKVSMQASAGPVGVDASTEVTLFEFGGFYNVYQEPISQQSGRKVSLDLLGGGRYFDIDVKLGFPERDLSGDRSWVDPFVGARLMLDLSERWEFILRGDVGGFGVGSEIAWNGSLLFQYRAWDWGGIVFGYRWLYTDYEDGSGRDKFKFDATISGPLVGLNITF